MGKRNMNGMLGMLAAMAMSSPQAAQTVKAGRKNLPFGTIVISRHPERPDLVARGVVIGTSPEAAAQAMNLAYMLLPSFDPNLPSVKTMTLISDHEVEVAERVESDNDLLEEARSEANRILSNRATNKASFDTAGPGPAAMGNILELANFGTATPRNVECLGRFFYAVDRRDAANPVRRFGIVVGVDLAAKNVPSYTAVVAYRADPSEAGKECNCGQKHSDDPHALQMFTVPVEDLEATENVDEAIRRDAMRAVGADVNERRNDPQKHSMMVALGMKSGISDFCDGFQFADDALAAYKDAPLKGEIPTA